MGKAKNTKAFQKQQQTDRVSTIRLLSIYVLTYFLGISFKHTGIDREISLPVGVNLPV